MPRPLLHLAYSISIWPYMSSPKTPSASEASAPQDLHEQVRVRFDRMKKLSERGDHPYKNGFTPKSLSGELHQKYGETAKETLESSKVETSVAGRVMAIRNFGKAAFLRLQDRKGVFQVYLSKDSLSEQGFARYQELDVGDIVFCEGYLFRTKTNELSLHAEKLELLTKALQPLPEKFHGLQDVETRYRQRYVDLITSPQSRAVFEKRSKIVEEVRSFFLEREYLEVETPMMHPIAGGAAARPFVTHHNTFDIDLYLRIAPELYLKRLVVGGFDRVFEINRNFRNEGVSIKHNPEFTMLEFYQAYATYEDLIVLTEELYSRIAMKLYGQTKITYQGTEIELGGKWKRISVEDSILEFSGFKDKSKIRDPKAILEYGLAKKYPMDARAPWGNNLMVIFDEEVEAKLIQPTFVTHYPLDVSPLSRQNDQDPLVVDRFEMFIYGREMANAFSELNDPLDQRRRFEGQMQAKERGDVEACDIDEDFCTALEYGLPPTAGQGIGIDRMVMLFTDSASIRDVILFPQLRPQSSGPKAEGAVDATAPKVNA